MNEPNLAPSSGGFLARNEFLLRRLHSLSGIVPVGAAVSRRHLPDDRCRHQLERRERCWGPWNQMRLEQTHVLVALR